MKSAILYLVMLVISLHGAGIVSNIHKVRHHTPQAEQHLCDSGHSDTESTSSDEKQPQSPDEDEDCHLCLTLQTLTPTLDEPTPWPVFTLASESSPACSLQTMPTRRALTDHPARAPPMS